jgi:ribonuclease HII
MAVIARGELPTLQFEQGLRADGHRLIAGVDEVGRGSWAGPVVAAAVILPECPDLSDILAGVRDSKQVPEPARGPLAELILGTALAVGVGWSSHHVIDRDGLGPANRRALLRAVLALPVEPDALILDHFRLPECDLPQLAMPRGDCCSLSIAAASIVAKVFRDRWMVRCHRRFPHYGFASNKGYGTRAHREALAQHGPCSLHRRSFAPIAELCQ